MKNCKVCLEDKELNMFDKISKSGYRGTCRKCRNIKNVSNWLSKEGNKDKRREYMRVYMSDKYKNDPDYKRYSSLISSVNLNKKEIKDHFESLFDINMNWDNYSTYWEVDHIIPALKMIRLGYSDDEINDIRNLRPLKIEDNRSISKKEDGEYSEYKEPPSNKIYQKKWLESNKDYIKNYKKDYYLNVIKPKNLKKN